MRPGYTIARECLGEYCQYQYNGEPLFGTVAMTPRSIDRQFGIARMVTVLLAVMGHVEGAVFSLKW